MPWRESSVIEERLRFVARLLEGEPMTDLCREFGISRKTGYKIFDLLAGQRLGIKEVDEGIWLVSFMHYDVGYIDLEQRTLQTIDNPFGTRLSPMS
jgi:hypothetical protein